MSNGKDEIGWPSVVVAIALILLVAAVAVAAIVRYSVDDALKFWSALGPVVGLFGGVFVTYFFTRKTIATEQSNAAAAQLRAKQSHAALMDIAGQLDPQVWSKLKSANSAIVGLVEGK